MKYKRKITSGALALTLFVGGSSAYAANVGGSAAGGVSTGAGWAGSAPQFLNVKGESRGRKIGWSFDGLGLNHNRAIGEIVAFTSTGFTLEAHNPKFHKTSTTTPPMVAFDVRTDTATVYQKDGANASASDLSIGQKVIVVGTIDPVAQIVDATKVNVITKLPDKANRGKK
jgi:hypothetical protein